MTTLQFDLFQATLRKDPWLMRDCNWQLWFNAVAESALSTYGENCRDHVTLLGRILNEEVFTRLDTDDKFSNFDDYHIGMLALLEDILKLNCVETTFNDTPRVIEFRHARKIIKDCWSYPYVGYGLIEYLLETGLLDSATNSALEEAVDAAIIANPVAVAEYRGGKTKALGAIMGVVMKQIKGDPREINALIISKLSQAK